MSKFFKTKKEESKTRTPEEINKEYLSLAAQLGELEFNARTIPDRQEKITERIGELQEEMAKAQESVQAAVKAAQAVVKPQVVNDGSKQTA